MILEMTTNRMPPDIAVVQFTGKIMLGRESQRIETVVGDLLRDGVRKIIFDLGGVTYIDSAGLGMITLCSGKVTSAGGVFRVAGATGLAAKLFKITRLDTVIPFYPTVEAATEGLTPP
jgi:anti-sigma B factor antagonist